MCHEDGLLRGRRRHARIVSRKAASLLIGYAGGEVPSFDKLWNEFWAWTGTHPVGAFFFRGQAQNDPIVPKIGRPAYKWDPAREKNLLNAFERAARPFLRVLISSRWEWLALAQHHGAPTRLTDWSTSPLVAAWFAVSSFPHDTDAVLFALDLHHPDIETLDVATGSTQSGSIFKDPLDIRRGVYLMETPPVSARITTQRGIFTVHGEPTQPLHIEPTNIFTIPVAMRNDFQGQLLDIGIDASHIFPDLDGLCSTLDWRLRSGKGFSAFT